MNENTSFSPIGIKNETQQAWKVRFWSFYDQVIIS